MVFYPWIVCSCCWEKNKSCLLCYYSRLGNVVSWCEFCTFIQIHHRESWSVLHNLWTEVLRSWGVELDKDEESSICRNMQLTSFTNHLCCILNSRYPFHDRNSSINKPWYLLDLSDQGLLTPMRCDKALAMPTRAGGPRKRHFEGDPFILHESRKLCWLLLH